MTACPVNGCTATVNHGHLMCRRHWRRVPKAIQARVWETWRTVSRMARDRAIPARAFGEARTLHGIATREAIDAVEAKEKDESHER